MVYFGECCTTFSLRPVFKFIQAGVLCKWTADSQRLLLEHFDTIWDSPSHIYHSALPFLPSSSQLRECHNVELSLQVKVVKGLPTEWGMCSRTVLLDEELQALSYLNNTIAVGYESHPYNIIILNAITGSQTAILSGHTDWARSLMFSSDGTSLVSGSFDTTIKLWDIQTGGVVKTFFGHTNYVLSVSISPDCTRIASGSSDYTIRLWDVQTGECHCVIKQKDCVYNISFSPTDPQHLLFQSCGEIWQWDIDGHQIPPTYDGSYTAFSSDGTQFVLCNNAVVTVRNTDSRAIVAEFHNTNSNTRCCCFSPGGELVAVAADHTAYVWDITGPDPCLVEAFIGHTDTITSLAFSSPTSLISASEDKSVKFWQIGASPTTLIETDSMSTPLTSASIRSIILQSKDGITISSDLDGVVRIWDISTGICKTSFQTPAKGSQYQDVQLFDGRLIFVWHADEKIHIWDTEKGELLWSVDTPSGGLDDLRISGDGTKVFCLYYASIQAWSIWKGEDVGLVRIGLVGPQRTLTVDGSRVWIHYPQSEYQGWDFGTPDSSPIQLPSMPPMLHLSGSMVWDISQTRIKDSVTGKVVFQLSGRFRKPTVVQCDGHYLAAGYDSGEILILDFNHVFTQS